MNMHTTPNAATNEAIRALIDANHNRYCSVVFEKKDGSLRRMVIHQAQMKNNVLGTELGARMSATRKANNPNLVTAWDSQKRAFRSFHLDAVLSTRTNGRTIRWRTWRGAPVDHGAVPSAAA